MTNLDSVISSLSNFNVKYLFATDKQLIKLAKAETKLPNQIAAQLLIQFYNIIIPQNITESLPQQNKTARFNDANSIKTNLALIPNPNMGTFSIIYKNNEDFNISVINSIGIEVFKANVKSNTEISMPDHIASGIYYVKVVSNNAPPITQKISIIK